MNRRESRRILCGGVPVGGGAPISIQSMTTTQTEDVDATVEQIKALTDAGCQIVRVAIPNLEAAKSVAKIKERIDLPLVGDIHFDYRLAIAAIEAGVDKIRINPGNIGGKDKLEAVVKAAKAYKIPIRVGVNSGSLEKDIREKYAGVTPEGLAESALSHVKMLEDFDFEDIVISIKASDAMLNYDAHRILAQETDYPFHIGITESGSINTGKVKSAAGLGALLLSGIGDTMRVSLTGDPVREVHFAKEILKACGIRRNGVNLISCPTCGRCSVNLEPYVLEVEERLSGVENNLTVAIMGCEVNGPGEAREADFGMAFGKGRAAVFKKGVIVKTVEANQGVNFLLDLIQRED